MIASSRNRNFVGILAVTLTFAVLSVPLLAQDAKSPNTDLKLHKFVPVTAPENNASAKAALQASATDDKNSATMQQMQLLLQEKAARTPAQQKIDSNILYTIRMMQGQEAAPGMTSLYTGVDLDQDNRIVVDIVADVTPELLQQLDSAGALVLSSHPEYRAIRAIVPPNQIEAIANSTDVSFIGRKMEAITTGSRVARRVNGWPKTPALAPDFEGRALRVRKQLSAFLQQRAGTNTVGVINTGQGSVTTEGDATHLAARARGVFGVNGSGLKIGVLSDSANNTGAVNIAQATGDVPPTCPGPGGPCLTILQDFFGGNGSDEGTAMMEIIYDMAPGASLFFASAANSESSFAANIQALRTAGCDIIVDDIFYPDEPVFQDGIVAQAVNSVTASGALYFSSAGNEGNFDAGTAGYFEGDFNDVGSPAFPNGAKSGTVHNFGSGLLGDMIVSPGGLYVLQWADPFTAPTDDYDLFYVSSAGIVLGSSTNTQNGLGGEIAAEFVNPPSSAGPGDRLVVFKTTAANVRLFALKTIRGELSVSTAGETWGHSAASAAFSVAAAPAAGAFASGNPIGPFPNPFTTASQLETFTSDGPRRIIFNADGSPITPGNFSSTGGTVRNKPDITAADGVSTTFPFTSGLNPFYGTSAAAPSAASVAALVKSANPALTPAQIRTTLTSTALDISAPGFDRDSGNGIVMAFPALNSMGLTPAANPEIGAVAATENPGNGNGIIEPGEGASLTVQLKNPFGAASATGITAVLTTITPGVTITQPAISAYPDLPAGTGVGNNVTPFTFTVATNAGCSLNIEFKLTLTYASGPAPMKTLNFSVQTGVYTVTNNLGSTPANLPPGVTFTTGTQANRISRNGLALSCGFSKSFPGVVTVGSRTFDSYTLTTTQPACLRTLLTSPDGNDLFESVYLPNYVPTSIGVNYVGDAGLSGSPQGFSVSTGASQAVTLVVNDSSPTGTASGTSYTVQIPSCVLTNPSTINHPPIALAHDVTVTAATPGGTVAVSIDNGSSDPDVGDAITKTQTPPGPYQVGTTSVLLTVVDSKGATAQATANVMVLNPGPDLLITKTHVGNFLPSQVGATYTISVTSTGTLPTAGTVTVVDSLPTGLTATAMAGTGWTCTLATLTCSRADSLATGASYPPITLTVNVAAFPPESVNNTATVSGGGDVNPNNNVATDHTAIVVNPDLTIAVSHIGNFSQGQTNAVYTVTVTNSGTAPTSALVQFLDTLPPGLSFVSIGPAPGWSCSTFGNETCERNDPLAPNSSYPPVTIVVAVASNAPAAVTNSVNVFGGGELNVANDTATDPTTIIAAPNLIVNGTHVGNFSQGQPGTYTITVSNIGFAATNTPLTVTDSLPQAFTATAMSGSGWACTVATAICTRSDALASAASYPPITLTGNVGVAAPASTSNTVSVSGGGEILLADDGSVDPTTVNQIIDMTVTSSHVGDFASGQIGAVYTLVASNVGFSSTTAAVTVQDNLPGMTATAMSGVGWSCNVGTVICTRSDALAPNSSYPPITLTVNVQQTISPALGNTVVVSGGGETNLSNDTGNDLTILSAIQDMSIAASHVGNFFPGQLGAMITIVASNSGKLPTNGAVDVFDEVPMGLSFSAMSGTGWTCIANTHCSRSDVLAAGASYPPLTLTVNVAANATGNLDNLVTVSGGGESNTLNDAVDDLITIAPVPDLTITKTHAGNFTQGQQGGFPGGPAYTIMVTNSGVGSTTLGSNVTVVDALPPSLTATGMLGTGWTCTLATLTCVEHDQLAPGASYPPITLSVLVGATAPASVTNTATVSGGGEVNTSNDIATDVTAITQLADLTIGATIAPPGFFLKGQTGAQFAFIVTNSGNGPTSGGVTVVGNLPADLTATAIAGTGWSCTLATTTCTRSDVLAAGASYPGILVTMNVSATASATVSTTATVSGGGEIIVNNDSVTFNTTITTPPAVNLSATSLSFPNQGVNTTSTSKQIVVTNTGGQTLAFPGLFATVLTNATNWAIAAGTTCVNGVNVAAGGQCVINVTFTPTAVGNAGPDTLTLNNNATPSHQDITLTGTGIDFTEGGPVAPVTITAGQTANFTITLTPGAGGFANAVSFSASGFPLASSGSFNPPNLTPGSTATSTTFSIATTARGALPPSSRPKPWTPPQLIVWMFALASIICVVLAFRAGRQRRYVPAAITAVVIIVAMTIAGCGSAGGPPPPTGTPAGTYPITVTATSGSLVHSTTVTLTVQ